MSREEEHRCALAYVKTKDPVLGERLIVANMRMVVALAHHHCRADDDLRDLIQEGNRGLLRALEKYDPTRGLKFCTYAVWWIRAYMLKFTMDNWRLVKVGTTQAQRKLFFCLRKERDRLEQTGAEADTRALASRPRRVAPNSSSLVRRIWVNSASSTRRSGPGAETSLSRSPKVGASASCDFAGASRDSSLPAKRSSMAAISLSLTRS